MAQLFIVPKEDYAVIRKYLFDSDSMSVILVPEDTLEKPDFPKATAKRLRELDCMEVNYDFGGEPDIFLDVITTKDHYALASLVPDPAYGEEELNNG